MQNKLILYIAMSLDGYIADQGGGVDFLYETPSPTPDLGYEAFYRSIGLPVRLSEAKIGDDRLQEMAENAMIGTDAVGMAFPLHADDILEILKLAA